jgi:hypothetical protein
MKPRRRVVRPFGRRDDFAAEDDVTPLDALLVRSIDELHEREIETIAVSIGATGARRPASE